MKMKFLVAGLFILTGLMAEAQDVAKPVVKPVRNYFGIQPGVRPFLFDEYGLYAWDINLLPLTLEYAIDRHWALKMHTIWNIEIRPYNYPAVMASTAIEISAPFYLSLKNSEEGHRGFYIAPVVTPGYNLLNKYFSLGLGGEAGFSFLFGNRWSFSVSAQAGTEIQKIPSESFIRFVPYTIPVIALGIWL